MSNDSPAHCLGGLAARARKRTILLLTAASLVGGFAGTAHAEGDTLRLLTFNIWNRFKQQPDAPAQLLIPGNYDAVLFQEESGSRYVTDLPGILQSAGLGDYQGARNGSSGIISRLPGTVGTYKLPGVTSQGRDITYSVASAADGRPTTTIGSVHFDYGDGSTNRIREAKALNTWATQVNGPLIMGGDFNSGDVAERGLHDVQAQIRLIRSVGSNSLYRTLAYQYIANGDEAVMRQAIQDEFPAGTNIDSLSWAQWGNALASAAGKGKDVGLRDETYAVAGNTPVTQNILKKQFVMMQTEAIREQFAPHELGDGSTTWPSYGEDATNTWASWDRSKIDHFLISRPYSKWYALTDDPADEYLGVVDKIYVDRDNGTSAPLSDHDLVGHEFTWVGPQLDTYATAEGDKTRLTWGEGASSFDKNGKVFELTRNNMRTDLYLGQISDENGNPTLDWLSLEEKKTLLDCGTSDGRLAAAVAEYCIDDHSFIGETLVEDGGTVVVTEDAAMGNASADLRLADGGLRIDGTAMDTLGRDVSLEGVGGFVEVTEATANVQATGIFSGEGGLTKRGEGTLSLLAENTYTGNTDVEAGTLLVNGSIASSALTSVSADATLGGTGTVGDLVVSPSGRLAPGDSGIGALTVAGDLTLDGAFLDIEIGASGFDTLSVLGDFTALSDYTIRVSFLDGFLPGAGQMFEFLSVEGNVSDNAFDFANLLLPLGDDFLGLSLFGSNDGKMALAWTNPYVAAVPLPLPALMLLSGLGMMGVVHARRKKAA